MTGRPRLLRALTALLSVLVAGCSITGPPAGPPVPTAPVDTVGRRGLWYAIGASPTRAQLDAAPARYGVVVLNAWDTAALHRLHQLDRSIVVLVYQDLSSTRSYDTGPTPPSGVGWAEASAHPSWFALDTAGGRISWAGYDGHWQMRVWDTAYQEAWVRNVTALVTRGGWDGVLADNDLATLHWYSGSLLAGTTSAAQTDSRLRSGLSALLARAGPALNARGKLLVPNVSDARLYPGRWAAHGRWGGAMEENFVHFGTTSDQASFLLDAGTSGDWSTQTAELAGGRLALAVTAAADGDTRPLEFGYASLLVRGGPTSYWQPTTPASGYAVPPWLPQSLWPTGTPVEAGHRLADGVWVRRYAHVWAAANPATVAADVTPPAGATDADGAPVTRVHLPAGTGTVLRLP